MGDLRAQSCATGAMTPVSLASTVSIPVSSDQLAFEQANTSGIDAHWAEARTENPRLFDGPVHFVADIRRQGTALSARAIQARFATVYYWRKRGYPSIAALHLFGFALMVSSDGAILLGRMSRKTSNAGRVYCPGGVVDRNDVRDGRIDISGNVRRELEEETGLTPKDVAIGADYIVVQTDMALAVGHRVDLPWPAEEARARVLASTRAGGDGEIADILIFRTRADAAGHDILPYARHLLDWHLPEAARHATAS